MAEIFGAPPQILISPPLPPPHLITPKLLIHRHINWKHLPLFTVHVIRIGIEPIATCMLLDASCPHCIINEYHVCKEITLYTILPINLIRTWGDTNFFEKAINFLWSSFEGNHFWLGLQKGKYKTQFTDFLQCCRTAFWRSPSHGAQPLGLMSSHQSSHQGAQARPAHPPPPELARHLRLTNQAALRCQGEGRGRGWCCWAHRENENYSQQCAQARPAHPPSPKLSQWPRLTNPAALRGQGEGRGRGWCCWAYPGPSFVKVETQGLARATQPTSRSET